MSTTRWCGRSGRSASPYRIAAVRGLAAQGARLYLWSTGGATYARSTAVELGLCDCFVDFLPKPDAYIDDQTVQEWRDCRHVLPANAADEGQ